MNIILRNPYRTLGLLVGATAKERHRQASRLRQFIEAEQEADADFSFPVLGALSRSLDDIEEAAAWLTSDENRIYAALFWFWNGNDITDEAAFDALRDGKVEEAIEIWRQLVEGKEISRKNASAYHNLSVCLLGCDSVKTDAIRYQMEFLESDFVMDFKEAITDATCRMSKEDIKHLFLSIINELAKEFLQCGIDNYLYYQYRDIEKGYATTVPLLDKAEALAVGAVVKQKIADNRAVMQRDIERHNKVQENFRTIAAEVKLFKETTPTVAQARDFAAFCKTKLDELKAETGATNASYRKYSRAVAGNVVNKLVAIVNQCKQDFKTRKPELLHGIKSTLDEALEGMYFLETFDMEDDQREQNSKNIETMKKILKIVEGG